jgi:hypothetical protein
MPTPNPSLTSVPLDAPGPVPEDNQPGHHPEVEQDKPTGPPRRRTRPAPATGTFGFRFEALMIPAAALVGVRPSNAKVEVGEDDVSVRFGHWSMSFPRSDVESAEVTGPYHLLKVAGPPHVSFSDRGVTFATNRQTGVCIRLLRPRPAIEPLGLVRHPALTVTVDDPDGLCELLAPS